MPRTDTKTALERLVYGVEPGETIRYRNMFCLPLLATDRFPRHPGVYFPLERAKANGEFTITEKGCGTVPHVHVECAGEMPVFIPAGRMIRGLKQNRIVIASVVIRPGTKGNLDVRCGQKGRWSPGTGSDAVVDGETTMSSSLVPCGSVRVGQDDVWGSVADLNTSTGTHSESESLVDVQRHVASTVTEYCEALTPSPSDRLVGALVGMPVDQDGGYHMMLHLYGKHELAADHLAGAIEAMAVSAAAHYPTFPAEAGDGASLAKFAGPLLGAVIRTHVAGMTDEPIDISHGQLRTGKSQTGKQITVLDDMDQPLYVTVRVR